MTAATAPVILVNIAQDKPARGDSHGRLGLANAIAAQTGGRVLYADTPTLAAAYPHIRAAEATRTEAETQIELSGSIFKHDPHYADRLAAFLLDNGAPDIVLGHDCHDALNRAGFNSRHTLKLSSTNEGLAEIYLGERELVAHALTPAMLAAAGRDFDAAHADLPRPLTAVFLADISAYNCEEFAGRMASVAAAQGGGTIFFCGCGRTNPKATRQILDTLDDALVNEGIADQVAVRNYAFTPGDPDNPYKGLIARADHFIVWGCSQSLVSEPLLAGKTVHIYNSIMKRQRLLKNGLVAEFNESAHGRPLATNHFTPVNITDQLAQALTERQRALDEKSGAPSRAMPEAADFPDGWHDHLRLIDRDARHIRAVPADAASSVAFLTVAATINGMILAHGDPSWRADPRIAGPALAQNACAAAHADPALLDDENLMSAVLRKNCAILGHSSPRLRRTVSFCVEAARYHYDCEKHFDDDWIEQLRDDEDYMLMRLEKSGDIRFQQASPRLRQSPSFVEQAIMRRPHIYAYLDTTQQQRPSLARRFYDACPGGLRFLPPDSRANPAVVALAVRLDEKNRAYIPTNNPAPPR